MRSIIVQCVLLLTTVGFYLNSCQTSTRNSQLNDLGLQEQQQQQQQEFEDPADQEKGTALTDDKKTDHRGMERRLQLVHPKEPNAWFTRKMLLSMNQPAASRINECRERIEAQASNVPNVRALDEVALSIETTVSDNLKLYHWCFYQMMADLDIRLDADVPLLDDKARIFLNRMRSLWVLARALESVTDDEHYLSYLRTRYMAISQSHFGRNLEEMDAESFAMPAVSGGKQAGRFEE